MKVKPTVHWVLGTITEAMRRLRSLHWLQFGTPIENAGDIQGNASGAPAAKVAWPVDITTHDGASFVCADSFPAEYIHDEQRVYLLDDIKGTRHPGAKALRVNTNVFLSEPLNADEKGTVIRTAEYGSEGIKKNVFIPWRAQIWAHHLPPDQPKLSTNVHDQGRFGGLHYAFRVIRWVKRFCQGATGVGEQLYAVALNFTRNGDGTAAHGIASFKGGRSAAVLSREAGGPLTPADDRQHILGVTRDGLIHQGANAIDVLYGPVGGLFGPEEIIEAQWERGGKGPFVKLVEKRPDYTDKHKNACGKDARMVIKWQTWSDWNTYPTYPVVPPVPPPVPPPTDVPPEDSPPPRRPEDPGEPGRPVIDPGPIPAPLPRFPSSFPSSFPSEATPPTTETPNETGIPSEYGHPVPNVPDARGANDAPAGDGAASEKLPGHDFTLEQFLSQPRVGHRVYAPVYKATTAASTGERWPAEFTTTGQVFKSASGEIIGNKRGTASGNVITLAPEFERLHRYYSQKEGWPTTLSAFYTIFGAGKNAAGTEFIGGFGIGLAVENSYLPAAGWYFKLDYTDGHDVPNLDIRSTDENGRDASTGRVLKVNGTTLTGLTGNAVTQAATTTSTHAVFVGETGNRARFETPVIIDKSNGNTSGIGTLASGAHTITQETLGDVVRTHQSTATNDDPGTTDTHNRVATANATATTLHTITLATGKSYIVSAKVIGVVTTADSGEVNDVGNTVGYHLRATLRNSAGTAIIVGQTSDAQEEATMATCACVFDATGATVRVRVTGPSNGASDTVMTWHLSELILSNPLGS